MATSSLMDKKAEKWAVIVIHGMGEQKPMSTLRSFVDAVLPPDKPHQTTDMKFYSKPDPISNILDVRKLSSIRQNPRLDFFEYYWAPQAGDGKWRAIRSWLFSILRHPFRLNRRLVLPSYILLTAFAAVAVVIAVVIIYLFSSKSEILEGVQNWDIGLGDALAVLGLFVSVVSILLTPFFRTFLNYIGDVEQYLRPKPQNIDFRQRVRSDGIQLLQRLHKADYDRIILVGHSLGSIIGYDLIKQLWISFNDKQRKSQHFAEETAKIFREKAEALNQATTKEQKETCLKRFQSLQECLWRQQKKKAKERCEEPWLISDFITLGSPLTHAKFLLAEGATDLEIRKVDRELPTCPPQEDLREELRYFYRDKDERFPVPHHAAPFVCVRWTNIYFWGDLVGGPLQEVFGMGIKDVKAKRKWFIDQTPLSHTKYWKPSRKSSCIETLREHLGLVLLLTTTKSRGREAHGALALWRCA